MTRKPALLSLIILAGVFAFSICVAQAGEWREMRVHDLRTPSSSDLLQTVIWPDRIREQNANVVNELKQPLKDRNAFILARSATFVMGERSIIVSTITSRHCDTGANHSASGIERSICPLRIAVLDKDVVIAKSESTGCMVEPPEGGVPPANQQDTLQARLDPKSGEIQLRALIGGRWIAECSRSYPLPH